MNRCKEVAGKLAEIYHPLSPDGIDRLAEILVPMSLKKGTMLLREGETARFIWFVVKGFIRQFYYKKKKDLTEHLSFEGDMVMCIESFYLQEPTVLQAEAMESSKVYAIPYDKLNQLAGESCELGILYRKILERSLIISQRKANSLRFETAKARYEMLKRTQPEALQRAPINIIASLLQMSPETLSRVRSQE